MNENTSLQFRETLNSLIQTLIKPETLKRELFFAMLLTVIKANHFSPKGKEINIVDYVLSKRNRDGAIYEAELVLNPFQDTPVKIIACPLDNTILVNGIAPDISKDTYSLCLDVNRYIKISELGTPSNLDNLDELYVDVIDNIVNPIKSDVLNYHNMPSSSLIGLPEEILQQIILCLPIIDVITMAKVCKRLDKTIDDEQLWYRFYKRDFDNIIKSKKITWRNKYKNTYINRRNGKMRYSRDDILEEFPENYATSVRDPSWEIIV